MLIEEAREIFIDIGRSYFFVDIGIKSVQEIIQSMKKMIQYSLSLEGLQLWEREKDAVLIVSEKLDSAEIDQILLHEFGILLEDFGNSKEFAKDIADELDVSIQQTRRALKDNDYFCFGQREYQ